jgi:hypothetical protein
MGSSELARAGSVDDSIETMWVERAINSDHPSLRAFQP